MRFISSDELMSGVLTTAKAQQHGTAGRRLHDVMKRLGWAQARVWLNTADKTKRDPDNPRGFIRKTAGGVFDPGWMEPDDDDPTTQE